MNQDLLLQESESCAIGSIDSCGSSHRNIFSVQESSREINSILLTQYYVVGKSSIGYQQDSKSYVTVSTDSCGSIIGIFSLCRIFADRSLYHYQIPTQQEQSSQECNGKAKPIGQLPKIPKSPNQGRVMMEYIHIYFSAYEPISI